MKKILLTLIALLITSNIYCIANVKYSSPDSLSLLNILKSDNEKKAIEYYTTATKYSSFNDHENAIKYYTKAIELDPDFIQAYIGRAKDCGDIGNWQCSLENYEMVKRIQPDDPDAYWATSLYKTNTKDLDGAMEDIDKAISMVKKPDATYYAQKAWVYLEKKDYDNAVEWAKKALKQNPKDEYTLGLISVMAYENGMYKDVLDVTNASLKYGTVAKQNPVLLLLRAKALYYTGQKDKAIKQLDDVIKLAPDNEEYSLLKDKMLKGDKNIN